MENSIHWWTFPYRVEDWHYEGKNGTHVEVEHRHLITVPGVDHVEVVVVDAGNADHQHGGDDEAGVVHCEAKQQSVHGTRHRGTEGEIKTINFSGVFF